MRTGRPASARRWRRITWPLMTIAARVPSRDSCSSAITPGKRLDTAAESTGSRAGCPEAVSWMARSTVLPSATTHTASSSDQVGRERVCPSAASHRLAAEVADPQRRRHVRSAGPKRHHRGHLMPVAGQRGRGLIRASARRRPAPGRSAGRPAPPLARRSARARRPRRPRPRPGRWPRRRWCSTRRRTCRRARHRRR